MPICSYRFLYLSYQEYFLLIVHVGLRNEDDIFPSRREMNERVYYINMV